MKRSRIHLSGQTTVPCDGCTLCCQGDAVRLLDEDSADHYVTEPHPLHPDVRILAHKPNGDCIYLNSSGCAIHGRAPLLCRSADCRSIALRYDYITAIRLHRQRALDIRVWDRGIQLLEPMKRNQKTTTEINS